MNLQEREEKLGRINSSYNKNFRALSDTEVSTLLEKLNPSGAITIEPYGIDESAKQLVMTKDEGARFCSVYFMDLEG